MTVKFGDISPIKFRPSAASRWANCTASVSLSTNEYTDIKSDAGNKGNELHEIMADAVHLRSRSDDKKELIQGYLKKYKSVNEDDIESCWGYIAFLDSLRGAEGKRAVEQKLSYNYTDKYKTTCYVDAIITHDNSVHIVDLKTGFTPVKAYGNLQMVIYALAAMDTGYCSMLNGDADVSMHIWQPGNLNPATEHGEWTWKVKFGMLQQYRDLFAAKIKEAHEEPVYKPDDDRCRYCPAFTFCEAAKVKVEKAKKMALDKDYARLSNDEAAEALEDKNFITKFFKALEDNVKSRLEKGEEVGEWALADSFGNNAWKDEIEAEDFLVKLLGDKAYSKTLLSPPKAEKLVKELPDAKEAKLAIKDLKHRPLRGVKLTKKKNGKKPTRENPFNKL